MRASGGPAALTVATAAAVAQSPLQPLQDNLESTTYETFERDGQKYSQYQLAVEAALRERVPDAEASSREVPPPPRTHTPLPQLWRPPPRGAGTLPVTRRPWGLQPPRNTF